MCILLITLWPLDLYIQKGYQICCTQIRLELGKGLASISVIPSSRQLAKHGDVGESVCKCHFSHGGRPAQMHFSPSCTRPIWMQPTWEESQENRLQLGESFVATESLEMSLCTLYARMSQLASRPKNAKFFTPVT